MEISDCIKDIQRKLCISQNEVARMIGINQATICYYVSGKRNPSLSAIKKLVDLAKANGLEVEYSDFKRVKNI